MLLCSVKRGAPFSWRNSICTHVSCGDFLLFLLQLYFLIYVSLQGFSRVTCNVLLQCYVVVYLLQQ